MIDFRSDTVTQPGEGMRRAMADAEVGDDVFRDDPTVLRLEATLAELLGMDAGLFLPSGTQSNLCAIMAHCQRGDEYIASQSAHCYRYEAGGAAVLGSVQPQPIEPRCDGSMPIDSIRAAIKPDDEHFARTRLLCLENTTGGRPLSMSYVVEAQRVARAHDLALHLDGARLFNAAIALGVEARALANGFDSVSICLSKGLGAPAGSVLVGRREVIEAAKRWRKMLGGAMRQAGILAAAGLYALEHHVDRLAEDHENARRLGRALNTIDAIEVDPDVPTNMVFAHIPKDTAEEIEQFLRDRGVLIYAAGPTLRLVTHLDIATTDIDLAVEGFRAFFDRRTD